MLRNILGEKFGLLTVVSKAKPAFRKNGAKLSRFNCICDCGAEAVVRRSNLVSGHTQSCGCLVKSINRNKRFVDKTGNRYGRLLVQGLAKTPKGGRSVWRCLCECGSTTEVISSNLRKSGGTKSCGCLARENASQVGLIRPSKSQAPPGPDKDRLQKIHRGMIDRCTLHSRDYYKDYGGRGITVCAEWQSSFDAFHDWAINNGYRPDLSIDRIDNDAGYSPSNCRWATRKQQAQNTRRSRHLTAFSETKTITDWLADPRCLVSPPTVRARLSSGWDFEKSISTPGMSKADASKLGRNKQWQKGRLAP